MKKCLLWLVLFTIFLATLSACAPLRKPLDKRSGFSRYLSETEAHIRQEEWKDAIDSLAKAKKAWKEIKPILQLDIDHDYVNDIENNFVLLTGKLETEDKPDSLALILLIQEFWKNIGEM